MKCECKVTLIGCLFLDNLQQPRAGEGEVAKYQKFLEKTQFLMNTLYQINNTHTRTGSLEPKMPSYSPFQYFRLNPSSRRLCKRRARIKGHAEKHTHEETYTHGMRKRPHAN